VRTDKVHEPSLWDRNAGACVNLAMTIQTIQHETNMAIEFDEK